MGAATQAPSFPRRIARGMRQMKTEGARSAGPSIALVKRWGRPGAPRSAILGTPVLLSGTKGPTGTGAITPPIPRGKVAPPVTGLGYLHPFGRRVPVPLRSAFIQPRPAGLP